MVVEGARGATGERSLPDAQPGRGGSGRDRADRKGADRKGAGRAGYRTALLIAALIAVVQAGMVLWFSWPATNTAPRDLPVVVAGQPGGVEMVTRLLGTVRPGGFSVTAAADQNAADQALRDRKAYAAFLIDGSGMSVHLASAASPAVATMVDQVVQNINAKGTVERGGTVIRTVDIVATPSADPRGAGFAAGFLPMLMTSMACGVLLSLMVRRLPERLLGLLTFAALSGIGGALALRASGVLGGTNALVVAALGLLTLAVSSAICGLGSLLGRAGIGLGVLTVFFFGNPIAGVAAAPEMLPAHLGTVGQALPPGAGASLLRSVAFFDSAGAGQPTLVLAGWAAAGLALCAVGALRGRARLAGAALENSR